MGPFCGVRRGRGGALRFGLAGLVVLIVSLAGGRVAGALPLYVSTGPFESSGSQPAGSVVVADRDVGGDVVGSSLLGQVVSPGGVTGLAFTGPDDLYGVTRDGFGSVSSLLRVDPDTGAVVDLGVVSDGSDDLGFSDLAAQPGTGTLFGITSDDAACSTCVYTIDTTTAIATQVGAPSLEKGGGLAFTPDGTLYLASTWPAVGGSDPQFELHVLDPATAAVLASETVVREVPVVDNGDTFTSARFDGLAADEDGTLYATAGGGATEIFQRIDEGSGPVWRDLGSSDANATDVAFRPVPEPAALTLLGAALLGGRAARRRGRRAA